MDELAKLEERHNNKFFESLMQCVCSDTTVMEIDGYTYRIQVGGVRVFEEDTALVGEVHLVDTLDAIGILKKPVKWYFVISKWFTDDVEVREFKRIEEGKMARSNVVNESKRSVTVDSKHLEQNKQTIQEKQNMKIENVTLINGTQAGNLSDEQIIQAIESEIANKERLQGVLGKTKSDALSKLVKKHEANIEELVAILDSRN